MSSAYRAACAGLFLSLAVGACKESPKPTPSETAASASASAAADPVADAAAPKPAGVARLALLGPEISDSGNWTRVEDKHLKTGAPIEADPGFVFELGTGTGSEGLDVTGFGAGGRAHQIWKVTEGDKSAWRLAEFQVTEAELESIVKRLSDIDFFGQPQEITNPGLPHGAQWILYVRTKGREKYVHLSGAIPEAFIGLGRLVTDLVNSRAELEQKSHRFSMSGLHDRHLWNGYEAYTQKRHQQPDRGLCLVSDGEGEKLEGLRIEGKLVDQATKKTVGKVADRGKTGGGLACVGYRKSQIDPSHDYVLELSVQYPKQKKPVATEPIPVITRGAPFIAFVAAEPD